MLQRTPTWMASGPRQDRWNRLFRRWLPAKAAYWLTRQKNIALRSYFFALSRRNPRKLAAMLRRFLRRDLGPAYAEEHFEPPYAPWRQRLCLVPDGDLFKALRSGQAEVVTDTIAGFDKDGVLLSSGRHLPADIVITATGLRLVLVGKVAISVAGKPVDLTEHYFYRGTMFSNLPNLAVVFGYLNASWTLRADINSDYICRVLNQMEATGTDYVVPVLAENHGLEEDNIFDFSSGYIQRSLDIMPKSAVKYPWRLNQEYVLDRKIMAEEALDDGILQFRRAGANAGSDDGQLEAAE